MLLNIFIAPKKLSQHRLWTISNPGLLETCGSYGRSFYLNKIFLREKFLNNSPVATRNPKVMQCRIT